MKDGGQDNVSQPKLLQLLGEIGLEQKYPFDGGL
jgi:hypothetical protein